MNPGYASSVHAATRLLKVQLLLVDRDRVVYWMRFA
jgi:hypothetical protein